MVKPPRKNSPRPPIRKFEDRGRPRKEPSDPKGMEDLHWGRQVVVQLLKDSPEKVLKIFLGKNVSESFARQVKLLAGKGNAVIQSISPEVLSEICGGGNHQGVACRCSEVTMTDLPGFISSLPQEGPQLVILLDHIQDPHNLGAVVRTAEACGAKGVLFPKRRGALPGGTVVKVSAGAALRLPMVAVDNVVRAIKDLQEANFWVVGMDNNQGRSLWSEPLQGRTVLVVGAEGEGLSRLVGESCDEIVRIPIEGGTGSLNASVACAVAMFEWVKKWGVGS